jgi:hypothetical protein
MRAKNRRQAADYQVEPTACTATDAVSLLKLLKHVAADVGVPLARQMILGKLLSGEIRTYRRWATGYPLFPTIRWAAKLESAPPSFVAEMEGLGFPDFFEVGESGIYTGRDNRTVFLYASPRRPGQKGQDRL